MEYSWEEVYKYWEYGSHRFPKKLTQKDTVKEIALDYVPRNGKYIYDYDWLTNSAAKKTEIYLSEKPYNYFDIMDTGKGTRHSAHLLAETEGEEEAAAFWIAATTEDLLRNGYGNKYSRILSALNRSAYDLLYTNRDLWHHAMTKLVPEIILPKEVFDAVLCSDILTPILLIQANTLMIKDHYTLLRYRSKNAPIEGLPTTVLGKR